MASSATASPDILEVLPPRLLDMQRFLLWREFPGAKPGKTRKTPFYASGEPRKGLLDIDNDLRKLVSFDEAMDVYMLGGYSGIGYAVVGGDNIGAFDIDHCLTEDGQLIDSHAGYKLVLEAKRRGAYIERSPSGTGLRIIGPCTNEEAYSKNDLEYWGAKRYVTLTGEVWANPGGWVSIDDLRDTLAPRRENKERKEDDDDDDVIITPRTIEELESALEAIDADERELWIRMGMALKTVGQKGYRLWIEWSKKSQKFNQADADRVWDSMRPQSTNYKAVFTEAQQEWGWRNPRKGKPLTDKEPHEDDDEQDEHLEGDDVSSLYPPVDYGDLKRLRHTEFILDGFLPAGVSVIAGAWGAGKSTNLIPLLASVCHLAPEEWGFWPTLRRHVIWITEAPEQAWDTLYSISKAEGAADRHEFKNWFHLFSAKRKDPKVVAKNIKKMLPGFTHEAENGFPIQPVVVLDTTTANLDIENESDNSMVGAAMSALKQALPGVPIVLIGHTPKALTRADVGEMTFRGAGAWEAEAAATYFLIYDQETEMRFMAIRKARFTPTYREIDFDSESGSEIVETPWGEPQAKGYLHGVPRKSDGQARKQARQEVIEEKKEDQKAKQMTERQSRVLAVVRDMIDKNRLPTKTAVREAIGGKAEMVIGAMDRLLESGLLVSHQLRKEQAEQMGHTMKGRIPEVLLPAEVDLSLFIETASNPILQK